MNRALPIGNNALGAETVIPPLESWNHDIDVKNFIHFILFKKQIVEVKLLVDKIPLHINVKCRYRKLKCVDEDSYHNFWSPLFHEGCSKLPHAISYRGSAIKIWADNYLIGYGLIDQNNIIFLAHIRHDVCNDFPNGASALRYKENHRYCNSLKYVNKLCFVSNFPSQYYFVKCVSCTEALKDFTRALF